MRIRLRTIPAVEGLQAWAIDVRRRHSTLGYEERRAFGLRDFVAVLERHTEIGATGEKRPDGVVGVSLFEEVRMHLSKEGLDLIARWEGWRGHVYLDAAGKPTIGFGHLLKPGENLTTITKERGLELLQSDAQIAVDAVNACVKVPLSQAQFDALCSFTFNCGTGALASSTLLRELNKGEYSRAADQLLVWCKVGTATNQGLLNRRHAERELFLRGAVGALPGLDLHSRKGIQQALNRLGWTPRLDEDGIWGPLSHRALVAWQAAHGLDDDGIPGPLTRAALAKELAK